MASVHDVAAAILDRRGTMSSMKLQKLVYYAQAWHIVWEDEPLFRARIEAWASGPVVPELYKHHRGEIKVDSWQWGDSDGLLSHESSTLNAVLKYYGGKSAFWLSELTHREQPWLDARRGLRPGQRGDRVITHAALGEYYSGLSPADE